MDNRPKVYIATPIPEDAERYIAQYCDYEKWEGEGDIPREYLLSRLKDKQGLIQSGIRINEELLSRAPNLKIVSNLSVGYNNYEIDVMKAHGVIGTHTPYVLDDTVADLIFGLILSAARRIPELDRYVKDGKWETADVVGYNGTDVHHSTLGIIGMGRIGEAVAKRGALGFDMKVLYNNRSRKPEAEARYNAEYVSMDELLEKSDFIVLMTPLTPETRYLIDTPQFSKMKKTALFINASRGPVVNEKALIDALEKGLIGGAGLDVYDKEPVSKDNPLLKLPRVVTMPHMGSATDKTRLAIALRAAENLVKGVLNQTPPSIVPELK